MLQASLTIAYILFGGGFRSLINFFSVASEFSEGFLPLDPRDLTLVRDATDWLFYFLTGASLAIVLAVRPDPLAMGV